MSKSENVPTRRQVLQGMAALLANLAAPTLAQGQSYPEQFDGFGGRIFPTPEEKAQSAALAQARRYAGDRQVTFKGEEIYSFYGISREDVLRLPGEHPSPDIYKDLKFVDPEGDIQECCHGLDCRPAIFRGLGKSRAAIGLNMNGSALFFIVDMKEVNIFSKGTLLPGNDRFLGHEKHACVVGGKVPCVVFEADM